MILDHAWTPEEIEEAIRTNATQIPEGYSLAAVGYTQHGGSLVVVAGPGLPAMAWYPPETPEAKGEWRRVVRQGMQA